MLETKKTNNKGIQAIGCLCCVYTYTWSLGERYYFNYREI